MTELTDAEPEIGEDRVVNVLVTITVLDDEGEELGESSASAETPEEAFALALGDLELDEE